MTELEPMTVNTHELRDRIDAKLRELARARQELSWASAAELISSKTLSRCSEMVEHRMKLEEMWQQQDQVEALTREITLLAERLELAGAHPHRKVSLSRETRLGYTHADAVKWLIEHHPELLRFDQLTFERLAREERPDFVSFEERPAVQIDNDLFEYLPEEIKHPLKSAVITQ